MFQLVDNIDPKMQELLRKTASSDRRVAQEHLHAIAQQFEGVLKKAVFDGDTLGNIYSQMAVPAGADVRFPLDIFAPGTEDDFVAFTMPKQGRVPERHIEGDELYIQTYRIANAIDWDLAFAADARWDVVSRAMEGFKAGFTKRINDDGWHVILASADSAGFMVEDTAATAGVFTPALVYRMKTVQKRRTRNGDLTDLYVSPEALEDLRNWSTVTLGGGQLGDGVRDRIFLSETDPGLVSLNGVRIKELRELGEGTGGTKEEYQEYFETTLGGSLGAGADKELVVGLDLSKRDSFIMPIREALSIHETGEQFHRQGRQGVYGWMRLGVASVDNRRAILGSF